MKYLIVFTVVLSAFFTLSNNPSYSNNINSTSPTVVELFTSQSCSSCPPADKVLGELSQNANVIALGYHVTYWNHLHWVDTLSMEESTELQREVNGAKNSSRIYTPQLVVNGREDFVGYQRSKIFNHISKNKITIRPIKITNNNDSLSLNIPKLPNLYPNLNLMIVGFDNTHTQKILRGENRGLTAAYSNPVDNIKYVRNWNGKSGEINIPISKPSKGYAVIIRSGKGGEIVAAGQVKP